VFVGVDVFTGVDVRVGVFVGVDVFTGVDVRVGVFVGVDVFTGVDVRVGVFVGVFVGVSTRRLRLVTAPEEKGKESCQEPPGCAHWAPTPLT
jgi:hypothetical protein